MKKILKIHIKVSTNIVDIRIKWAYNTYEKVRVFE